MPRRPLTPRLPALPESFPEAPRTAPRTARLLAAAAALAAAAPHTAAQGVTRRASELFGAGGNGISLNAGVSPDGRWVAFGSEATNLAPGDGPGRDVFLYDSQTGAVQLVSTGPGNSSSDFPAASDDADFVAFTSFATNLVPGDTNFRGDVFVWRRAAGAILRASVGPGSVQADDHCEFPDIDPGGTLVVFHTAATTLDPTDTNGLKDVYLRNWYSGYTQRISRRPGGGAPNGNSEFAAISADGNFVVYTSHATDIVAGDTNGLSDVFLYDIAHDVTTRVSVGTGGVQGNGQSRYATVSGGGRYVAFASESTNWIAGTSIFFDCFVHDTLTGTTELVSRRSTGAPSNSTSLFPEITPDGRFVAFTSYASNLVSQDGNGTSDVFLHDRIVGTTQRIGQGPGYAEGDAYSGRATVSDDAYAFAFESDASNLIPGGNPARDAFHHRRCGATPEPYCVSQTNSAGCTPRIFGVGTPRASGNDPFDVVATEILVDKSGLLFYGLTPAAIPFLGGTLCVQPPTQRTPLQNSGGSPTSPCSGALRYDFGARIHSGIDPALQEGTTIYAQYWSRDPGDPSTTNLTNALCFTIQP